MTDSDRVTVPEGRWYVIDGRPFWKRPNAMGRGPAALMRTASDDEQGAAWAALVSLIERAEAADRPVPEGTRADLRSMQAACADFAEIAWPNLTVEVEALALAEEVGELARCVVKRHHGNRGSTEDWTAELRREMGDVLLVLCNLAHIEGFDLLDAGAERLAVILVRDLDHDPVARIAEPPEPATEGVPWWEAVGRKTRDGHVIVSVGQHKNEGPWFRSEPGGLEHVEPTSGIVAVLVDGDKP